MISPELKRNTQEMYQAESTDELSKKRHLIHYRSEKKSKEVISLYYLSLTQSLDQIFNTVLKGIISFYAIYR